MKSCVALLASFVLTACATAPSAQHRLASENYARVERSMGRERVLLLLGPPQGTDESGREHWWHEEGRYREDLWIRFGEKGQVVAYERNSSEN